MMIRALALVLLATTSLQAAGPADCRKAAGAADVALCTERASTDITTYFRLVPLSVFDTTTDGLEAEEQRTLLLEKGESEDWTYKRLSAAKATLRAKHGNSTVTMSLMKTGPIMLQVHVQNEKAETITYWTLDAANKPLVPFTRR
jgi:uncharacterized protein